MFISGIFRTNHSLSPHVHRKLKFKLTQIQMLFSVHDNLAFIKELFIRSRISPVSENVTDYIFVCISIFINIRAIEAGFPSFVLSFRVIQCLKLKTSKWSKPVDPGKRVGNIFIPLGEISPLSSDISPFHINSSLDYNAKPSLNNR